MGASACSVLGDWFPTEDTAKDIIINKVAAYVYISDCGCDQLRTE